MFRAHIPTANPNMLPPYSPSVFPVEKFLRDSLFCTQLLLSLLLLILLLLQPYYQSLFAFFTNLSIIQALLANN